jgi:HK97 family phage portal protein
MLSLLAPRGLRAAANIDDPRYWTDWIGRKTAAGVNVNEHVALTYSAVWAATRVFCAGGSIPLHMYRRTDKGNERYPTHSLEKVLKRRFNPEMEAGNGRRLMWQWQPNWGNADCEIIWDDYTGQVRELWPLSPWMTTIERNTGTGELRWRVRNDDGSERVIAQKNVFHLPSPISRDGIVGLGTIRVARESIGMGLATEKYGANWFGGDGVPRLVITTKGKPLDDPQKKSFREEWKAIMGGADGSKVATLGGDATVTPIVISQEDSQFLETRQHNVEEIARWYGIPPHLLQRMVQVTYNNAELLPLDFIKWTLMQYVDIWESAIVNQLVPEDEREEVFAKHNMNGLLRGDSKSRMEFYKGMEGMANITRNEVREWEDLPPVAGGDTFLVQGAVVPLDEDGKPESEFAGNAGPGMAEPTPEPDPEPAKDDNGKQVAAAVKRALHYQLSKAVEKEGKRAVEESRKAGSFVTQVDGFYVQHSGVLTEAVTPLLEAVGHSSPQTFIASWCEAGKQAVLAAADVAKNAKELETSVRAVLDAKCWTDRPLKAITSLEN